MAARFAGSERVPGHIPAHTSLRPVSPMEPAIHVVHFALNGRVSGPGNTQRTGAAKSPEIPRLGLGGACSRDLRRIGFHPPLVCRAADSGQGLHRMGYLPPGQRLRELLGSAEFKNATSPRRARSMPTRV